MEKITKFAQGFGAFRIIQSMLLLSQTIIVGCIVSLILTSDASLTLYGLATLFCVNGICIAMTSSRVRSKFWDIAWTLAPGAEDFKAQVAGSAKMSELGVMAASLGHEINNAIAVTMASAHMLSMGIKSKKHTAEQTEKQLLHLNEGLVRMAKIIRGMQTYVRDAEHDPFEEEAVEAILEDALALCQQKIEKNGIDLEVVVDDRSLTVPCRKTEISQVLVNLLVNAENALREFSADEKRWIKVKVKASSDQQCIEFEVSDNGPGVPETIRDKILDPFFTTKPVGQGTGLGLSLSKDIVERHGGTLELDRSTNHTTFRISLPRTAAHLQLVTTDKATSSAA